MKKNKKNNNALKKRNHYDRTRARWREHFETRVIIKIRTKQKYAPSKKKTDEAKAHNRKDVAAQLGGLQLLVYCAKLEKYFYHLDLIISAVILQQFF